MMEHWKVVIAFEVLDNARFRNNMTKGVAMAQKSNKENFGAETGDEDYTIMMCETKNQCLKCAEQVLSEFYGPSIKEILQREGA